MAGSGNPRSSMASSSSKVCTSMYEAFYGRLRQYEVFYGQLDHIARLRALVQGSSQDTRSAHSHTPSRM